MNNGEAAVIPHHRRFPNPQIIMKRIISIIAGVLVAGASLLSAEPDRERGINLYQMPESGPGAAGHWTDAPAPAPA